ncbi:MAG: carbohydrate ABC transporter permease [Clostridia bacterium]|nr:carbohydrate ABC transporter permease [Clostridia bacterium]
MNKREFGGQVLLNVVFIILCALIIVPFLLLLAVSITAESDITKYGYQLIPHNIDFSAYQYIFKSPKMILDAYKITATFSFTRMFFSVLLMSMIAYPLTKREFKGKSIISFYLYFTMLFNGGLVPTYILITQYLHLKNSFWVYIFPGLISPWYVFMIRTFFQGLPYEISEAALIDGADEYQIFTRIILPLSKPVLATVALFMFLSSWNDWNTSMLYITEDHLYSLQYLLQRIMENIKLLQEIQQQGIILSGAEDIPSETMRMAMAVVVAGPALIVFPFFQKYFVKGLTVGSVKG